MQGMTRQKQPLLQFRRPSITHPFEIFRTIARIKFVANDRISIVRQMHADLMHATGLRKTSDQRVTPPANLKSLFHLESREAFAARRMDHLPDPNRRRSELTFTQNGLRICPLIHIRPSRHDRKVFFLNLAPFENNAKLARCESVLGHQDKPARVTVQAVHDRWLRTILHFEHQQALDTAEQGWLGLAIGRMHNQGRWLIHHKPVGRLVDHRKIHDNLQAHPTKSHQPTPRRNLLLPHGSMHLRQKNARNPRLRISGI